MVETLIIQGIGFIGVACFILSYQIKSNKALYLMQMAGSGLFCVQFLLMGAYSGCLNLVVIMIRNILLTKADDWKWIQWKGWVGVITAVCIVILYFTWAGPLSLLPFIALVAATIGYWTNNAQKIRLANLVVSCPAWLVYDIAVGSIGGVINEIVTMGSIVVSIYRYGWKNMNDPDFGKKSATPDEDQEK